MIEQKDPIYPFSFKVDELTYNFNIPVPTRAEALKILRASMASVISDINQELNENK